MSSNPASAFISHVVAQQAVALELQAFLKQAFGDDFQIFVSTDSYSIGGGQQWFNIIVPAVKSSDVVLVLISEESVEQRWINFESGIGIGANKLVIPLVIKDFQKRAIGLPLSILQARDLGNERDLDGLLEDIARQINKQKAAVDILDFIRRIKEAERSIPNVISEEIKQVIRRVRSERVERILAGETPVEALGPKIVLHIIPSNASDPAATINLATLDRLDGSDRGLIAPLFASYADEHSFNSDGFLALSRQPNSYLQIFHNGVVESVDAGFLPFCNERLTGSILIEQFQRELLKASERYLSLLRLLNVSTPVILFLSLHGVAGRELNCYSSSIATSRPRGRPINEDTLWLPEVIVQTFEDDPNGVMKPIFDRIWQAAGRPQSEDC